jgi:hypothetical protein
LWLFPPKSEIWQEVLVLQQFLYAAVSHSLSAWSPCEPFGHVTGNGVVAHDQTTKVMGLIA